MRKAGALVLLFWFLAVACSKVSDDVSSPQVVRSTLGADVLQPGEALTLSVEATDNEMLNQARVRILSAFSKNFGAWKVVNITNLSGKSFATNYVFTIPDTAIAGLYSVGFQVVDERGNASPDTLQYFTIKQPGIAPELVNFETTPFLSTAKENVFWSTDSITFSGWATGDSLTSVSIELKTSTDSNIKVYNYPLEGASKWSFELHADTVRFSELNTNPVRMVVRVTDNNGHQDRINFPLRIIQ